MKYINTKYTFFIVQSVLKKHTSLTKHGTKRNNWKNKDRRVVKTQGLRQY